MKANQKILAFAGDGLILDYYHPKRDGLDEMMAEFFLFVGAFFAQIELNRFQTRATDRLDYLRTTDRVTQSAMRLAGQPVRTTPPHRAGVPATGQQ